MKYDELHDLLTASLPVPPPISAADAHELVIGAQAVSDWCRDRMTAVPASYRVNSAAAVDGWARCAAAAKRVREANTAELAQREAQACYQFAVQVARDADINRARVARQIASIDRQREPNRRESQRHAYWQSLTDAERQRWLSECGGDVQNAKFAAYAARA